MCLGRRIFCHYNALVFVASAHTGFHSQPPNSVCAASPSVQQPPSVQHASVCTAGRTSQRGSRLASRPPNNTRKAHFRIRTAETSDRWPAASSEMEPPCDPHSRPTHKPPGRAPTDLQPTRDRVRPSVTRFESGYAVSGPASIARQMPHHFWTSHGTSRFYYTFPRFHATLLCATPLLRSTRNHRSATRPAREPAPHRPPQNTPRILAKTTHPALVR